MKDFLKAPVSNTVALLAAIALLVAQFAGGNPAELTPLALTGGTTNFSTVRVDDGTAAAPSVSFTGDTDTGLYRAGANNLALTLGGTQAVSFQTTGVTLADGSLRVNDFVIADAAAAITVSNGVPITPTSSYQPLTAGGNAGTTLAASGFVTGTLVTFENLANVTITITDTATTMLGGNAALGQYDTLVVIWDGTNWVQLSKTDN